MCKKGAHPLRTFGALLVGRIAGWREVLTRSFDRLEKVAYVRRRWRVAERRGTVRGSTIT